MTVPVRGATEPGVTTTRDAALRFAPLALLVCALIGVPLALAVLTGALGIPHNDAWSHSRIAQEFAATGEVTLVGWNRASLVGQVVVLGPLGAQLAAQHLFVAACGAVCLVMTYLLVRPRAGAAAAALATITLGVVPEFGLLSTAFMADVPALAGTLTCLWAGDQAIRRDSLPCWWLGIVVGVWAVTVREQAVVAPAALLVAAWLGRRPRRSQVALAALVVVATVTTFELWRRTLPADDPPDVGAVADPAGMVLAGGRTLFTLGLFLLPVVAAVARPLAWRPLVRWAAGGTVLVAAAALLALDKPLLLGNYVARTVAYGAASVGAPEVIPRPVWGVVLAAAATGAVLLLGQVMQFGLTKDPLLLVAGGLLLTGTVAEVAVGQDVFSRSFLLCVPVGAGLLLPRRHVLRLRLGLGVAVLPLLLAVVLTAATYSYDAARWAVAEQLVEAGASPQDVDAGLEWVETHAPGPYTHQAVAREAGDAWWVGHFGSSRPCHLVTGSPLPGRTPDRTFRYPTYGLAGSSELYVYSNGC